MAYLLPYNFKIETILEEGRTTPEAIDQIRNWLPTVNLPNFCDELIFLFLLSCENVIEATKTTIIAYFKCKNGGPELFNNRDVDGDELQKVMKTICSSSIPTRTDNNDVIHFFKLTDTYYGNFDLIGSIKVAYMIVDVSQRYNPPDGLIVLFDMKGLGFMHLSKLKLAILKKFIQFLQEAMPLKLKAVYILNSTYLIYKILDLIKYFMKSELMQQIKMFPPDTNMEEFYRDYIPAKCLPKEYGGHLPCCDELNQRTIEQFRELKSFFEAEEKLRQLAL